MYIHKYKPRKLSDISYNKEFNRNISNLAKSGYINNMLFHGIEGSGKKTFVMAYLAEIYGDTIHNIRTDNIVDNDVRYRNSNYHIEIDLGQHSSKNKKILIEFIKTYSSTLNVSTKQPKLIIFYNADDIPQTIQLALRRTIELYSNTARYIFICRHKNKIIEPLISRLFCLRVRGIIKEEAQFILKDICNKENISTTDKILDDIINNSIKYNNIINIRDVICNLNLSFIFIDDKFKYINYTDEFKMELNKIIKALEKDKLTDIFFEKIKDYIDRHMLIDTSYTDIIKYILFQLLEKDYSNEIKFQLLELICQSKIYMCNKPTLCLEHIMFSIVKIIR